SDTVSDAQHVTANDLGESVHDLTNEKAGTKTVDDVYGDPETRASRVNEAGDTLWAEAREAQARKLYEKAEALRQEFHTPAEVTEAGARDPGPGGAGEGTETAGGPPASAAAEATQSASATTRRFGRMTADEFFGTHEQRIFDVNLQGKRILGELEQAQRTAGLIEKADGLLADFHGMSEPTAPGPVAPHPGNVASEITEPLSRPNGRPGGSAAEVTERLSRGGPPFRAEQAEALHPELRAAGEVTESGGAAPSGRKPF